MDERATSTESAHPNVRCPACDYLLRGLPGAIVTCPECGRTCDVPKLIARRRTDWLTSRVYQHLFAAGVLFPFALLATLITFLLVPSVGAAAGVLGIVAVVLGGGWLLLIHRAAAGRLDRDFLVLVALSHGLQACLMLSAVIIVVGGAVILGGTLALMLPDERSEAAVAVLVSTAVVFGAIIFLSNANRMDRAIGIRCIRHELKGD